MSRHLRKLLLSLLCLLAPAAVPGGLAGQATPSTGQITGVVVSADSGEPLPLARVRVVEPHREMMARADGSFAFAGLAAGRYTLVVDQLGYDQHLEVVTLGAGATVSVRFELHVGALRLDEIVVTGSISRRSGREVLNPVSVVRGADLDRSMATTIAATLDREPGMAATGIGPATARPVIRGLGGDRILILEDGARSGDMSSTSADHAVAVDPITARQIEVVRGPMSLLYGSSALGGVVNVVREEVPGALPEQTHGSFALHGTSVNSGVAGGGHALFAAGPYAVRLEGSGRASGDVSTPSGPLLNTHARTLGLAVGAAHLPQWGHVGASYRYYDNRYGIPGGFVGGHEGGVDVEMVRHTSRLEAESHRPAEAFLSEVRATATYTNYYHAEIELNGLVGTEFSQDIVAGEVVARHGERGLFSEGALGVRAQYRDLITGGSLRTPSTWDYTLAAFFVEELGRGPLRLQMGARYDWARYEPRDTTFSIFVGGQTIPVRPRTFGSFSGSLGLLYAPVETVRLGASLARAYRTPDFNELYSDGPHLAANSYDVGDPSLRSETGLGVDAFVRVTRYGFRGELAVFRNRLDHFIFPSSRGRAETGTAGGRPRFQFTNEDALFTGVEGDVEWSPLRHLVMEMTTSFVQARFTSARAPIPVIEGADTTFVPASEHTPYIPPLNGNLGLRYDRPLYFVGASVRWAGGQERLGDFESATDGYALARATAGLRLLRGQRLHTFTLSVENLTDAEYRDHMSRIKDIMPQPGRNVSLMYRLTF